MKICDLITYPVTHFDDLVRTVNLAPEHALTLDLPVNTILLTAK